jgi:hypothetical protein
MGKSSAARRPSGPEPTEDPEGRPLADPTPIKPDTVTIELHGDLEGQWTVIRREQTGAQLLAMLESDIGGILRTVKERTVEHSFGGALIDQELSVLIAIVNTWTDYDRGAVLDQVRASGSPKPA